LVLSVSEDVLNIHCLILTSHRPVFKQTSIIQQLVTEIFGTSSITEVVVIVLFEKQLDSLKNISNKSDESHQYFCHVPPW